MACKRKAGPEFPFLRNPHQKLGPVVCMFISVLGRERKITGGLLNMSLVKVVSLMLVRDPVSEGQVGYPALLFGPYVHVYA